MEMVLKAFDMLLAVLPGLGVCLAIYVIYVGKTKGWPAAKAMVSGWWNKAKSDLNAVKSDVANAQTQIAALETRINGEIAMLKGEVATIKAKVGA